MAELNSERLRRSEKYKASKERLDKITPDDVYRVARDIRADPTKILTRKAVCEALGEKASGGLFGRMRFMSDNPRLDAYRLAFNAAMKNEPWAANLTNAPKQATHTLPRPQEPQSRRGDVPAATNTEPSSQTQLDHDERTLSLGYLRLATELEGRIETLRGDLGKISEGLALRLAEYRDDVHQIYDALEHREVSPETRQKLRTLAGKVDLLENLILIATEPMPKSE